MATTEDRRRGFKPRQRRRPVVLGVGGRKGGVGKTQTAVTLALLAGLVGYRVLLVDADEQQSAVEWVGRAGELMPFDVISEASPRRLARLHEVTGYDLVLVDLPGGLKRSGELRAVLTGTDGRPVLDALLLPTKTGTMDIRSTVRAIQEEVAPMGMRYRLVLTMVKFQQIHQAEQDRDDLIKAGVDCCRTILRDLAAHEYAVREDKPITRLPGGKRSSARRGEAEYRALAHEVFVDLLRLEWPDEHDTDQ
jgi:chromosome partitioning protein